MIYLICCSQYRRADIFCVKLLPWAQAKPKAACRAERSGTAVVQALVKLERQGDSWSGAQLLEPMRGMKHDKAYDNKQPTIVGW